MHKGNVATLWRHDVIIEFLRPKRFFGPPRGEFTGKKYYLDAVAAARRGGGVAWCHQGDGGDRGEQVGEVTSRYPTELDNW